MPLHPSGLSLYLALEKEESRRENISSCQSPPLLQAGSFRAAPKRKVPPAAISRTFTAKALQPACVIYDAAPLRGMEMKPRVGSAADADPAGLLRTVIQGGGDLRSRWTDLRIVDGKKKFQFECASAVRNGQKLRRCGSQYA